MFYFTCLSCCLVYFEYGQAAALNNPRDNSRCACAALQAIQHLLECVGLDQKCTVEDICAANNVALDTTLYWAREV